MKPLLSALLLLAFTLPSFAVDALEGAFGLKLGDVFTPTESNPTGIVRTDENARFQAFRFQPIAPNRHFFEYWVYVTPATRRIYRIVAVGRANNSEVASAIQHAIFTVARERYIGDFNYPIEDKVVQGTRSVSLRPPIALPDGTALWQVAYTDLALAGRILAGNNGVYEEVEATGL